MKLKYVELKIIQYIKMHVILIKLIKKHLLFYHIGFFNILLVIYFDRVLDKLRNLLALGLQIV